MRVVTFEGVRADTGDERGVLLEQRVAAGCGDAARAARGVTPHEARRLRREAAERVRGVVEQQVADLRRRLAGLVHAVVHGPVEQAVNPGSGDGG